MAKTQVEKTKKDEIKDDIKRLSDIVAVSESKGGKVVIESLQKDVVGKINEIRLGYKTASHPELIAMIASMSEKIAVLNMFSQAKKNKRFAEEELDFIVKEEKGLGFVL